MIYAVRGNGSHFHRIRSILLNFAPDTEFIFLDRDVSKWVSQCSGVKVSGIFILSPNSLHAFYVQHALTIFPCSYIYCEKPFLNKSKNKLICTKSISSGRVSIGFNLRYSTLEYLVNQLSAQYSL